MQTETIINAFDTFLWNCRDGNRAVSLIVFYLHFCQNWDMHIVGIVRTCSISSYT